MELSQLMQNISMGSFSRYMVWTGEEVKVADLYIEKIAALGWDIVHSDTVSQALKKLGTNTLDNTKKLYIVSEDLDYSSAGDRVWNATQYNVKFHSKNALLLRYSQLNKKYKFYKFHNPDFIVEFKHLTSNVLQSYILRLLGDDFTEANCNKLIEMCNSDYGRILLEVDKIKQYSQAKGDLDFNKVFSLLLKENAIYQESGDITFDLTDSTIEGYPQLAIEILEKAKQKGEPALRICSILYNGFRNLLSFKALGKNKINAGQRLGLTGWQIRQCYNWDGGYSISETKRNMLICQKVESGIKMGTISEDIALDYLILSCLA